MDKYKKARRKIFAAYTDNFRNYIDAIGQKILGYNKEGVFADYEGKAYACPLCWQIFTEHQIEENADTENFLTLEHNPPKVVGGKATILTCKKCNSQNGAKLDDLVGKLLVAESFLLNDHDVSINSRIIVGGNPIVANLKKDNNRIYITPVKKSNPKAYDFIFQERHLNSPFSVKIDLTVPEWKEYSYGLLKIAYLKAFELFGYYFADCGNGANIRDVLDRKMVYPCPNNGVIDINADSEMLGIRIVVSPEELQSLVITQKLMVRTESGIFEKNIPVILPTPNPDGWEKLANYQKYFQKEVNLKYEKIELKQTPFLNIQDYYRMFRNE